jgi:small-conductance mechanosensitive channel
LWFLVALIILNLLNINVATFVGSLGITSIAIAFALQNVLSDIFASLSIYFDRPFAIGDTISIGKDRGVVQKVGLKSTRIKTLQGEELVVSNKELTTVRIRNFKNLQNRRIEFCFKISNKTSSQKLRKIPENIAKIIKNLEICKLIRVNFIAFTTEGLEFEVVYLVKNSDYQTYKEVQQKINLEIKEMLEKNQIEL